jgi:N6-adenosine-specific RNA methylase IME4
VNALPTTPGGFPCVLADPPWAFRDVGVRGSAEGHYRTMRTMEIAAMPVASLAAPNALLFLWTTSAHLLDGSAACVCEGWGFEPKTTVAWVKARTSRLGGPGSALVLDKLQIGCGYYTRAAHELLVIARRGKARVRDRGVPSVIFAPRTRHSRKPDASYDVIERLTEGPRLELFARGLPRPGWIGWGDQFGLEVA